MGRPNVLELIASLKGKESEVRQKAAERLAYYGLAAEKPEYKPVMPREEGSLDDFRGRLKLAIPPLIETLKDKDQWVGLSTAKGLQKIGLKFAQRMVRRRYHRPCWMNRSVLPSGSST